MRRRHRRAWISSLRRRAPWRSRRRPGALGPQAGPDIRSPPPRWPGESSTSREDGGEVHFLRHLGGDLASAVGNSPPRHVRRRHAPSLTKLAVLSAPIAPAPSTASRRLCVNTIFRSAPGDRLRPPRPSRHRLPNRKRSRNTETYRHKVQMILDLEKQTTNIPMLPAS